MTKDYSWIKQGMYCSLENIEPSSEVELQIIDAFVKAGAYKDEGRDYNFEKQLYSNYEFAGWGKGGTCLIDSVEIGYYGCNQLVSIDFILNGGISSQQAITATLDSPDTTSTKEIENGCNEVVEIGKKFDSGKLRWSLLDFKTLEDVVEVLELGARKYSAGNFKYVEPVRYVDALMRHWAAYLGGEEVDSESGKSHLHHMMCCLMFLDYFRREGIPVVKHG